MHLFLYQNWNVFVLDFGWFYIQILIIFITRLFFFTRLFIIVRLCILTRLLWIIWLFYSTIIFFIIPIFFLRTVLGKEIFWKKTLLYNRTLYIIWLIFTGIFLREGDFGVAVFDLYPIVFVGTTLWLEPVKLDNVEPSSLFWSSSSIDRTGI